MNEIYILSSCNEWKEYSSMHLIMASTSLERIKEEIESQIKEGNMCYTKGIENLNEDEQIKMLEKDYKQDESFLLNNLEYGFINVVTDGERQ